MEEEGWLTEELTVGLEAWSSGDRREARDESATNTVKSSVPLGPAASPTTVTEEVWRASGLVSTSRC